MHRREFYQNKLKAQFKKLRQLNKEITRTHIEISRLNVKILLSKPAPKKIKSTKRKVHKKIKTTKKRKYTKRNKAFWKNHPRSKTPTAEQRRELAIKQIPR